MREICIAGRESRLAMAQNELVKALLEKQGYRVRILTVSTKGDRDKKIPVTELGGNGPFVRDVEKVLLSEEADIAVHCVKDLPYEMAPGLCIAGIPDAADPRDCLLLRKREHITDRPLVIGTGSPRRIRQLEKLYAGHTPGIRCSGIRGNITTRLDKLQRGDYDGIVLAKAGLDRIGADLRDYDVRIFETEEMIPAVGQGLLACECRADDTEMRAVLEKLTPPENALRFQMERELFCRFRCDCRSAIGIYARIKKAGAELLIMYEE